MKKYIIYCTGEQTKKALELGAPIYTTNEHLYRHPHEYKYYVEVNIQGNFYAAKIPTAEQMLGWLEEHGVVIDILSHYIGCDEYEKSIYVYDWMRNDEYTDDITYETRKEATIAAIDAALEYLIKNKK